MRRLLPTVTLELSPFIYGIELLCKRRCYSLKYLDTSTNGIHAFRNPRALSSALAALGTLQPRALGFLKRVDPSVSVSNLYIVHGFDAISLHTNTSSLERATNLKCVPFCHSPMGFKEISVLPLTTNQYYCTFMPTKHTVLYRCSQFPVWLLPLQWGGVWRSDRVWVQLQ